MDYATQQDMVNRFGEEELIQLTDQVGRGVIDSARVIWALNDAHGEIDAHLEPRYQLPLTVVPRMLVAIACDIARFHLYDDAAPEGVAKRYDNAIRLLRSIARGEVQLGAASESPETDNSVQFEGGGNVFDRKDDSFI